MVPAELQDMVGSARPFVVQCMKTKDILYWKSFAETFFRTTSLKITEPVMLTGSANRSVCIHNAYSCVPPDRSINVLKRGVKMDMVRKANVTCKVMQQTLDPAKAKDLQAMLPYLDSEYQDFYKGTLYLD
jgi:hypothetical protein